MSFLHFNTFFEVSNILFIFFDYHLPFLKTGVVLAFLQFSGIFLVFHDLSNMMEGGLAITSAKSLSTHG